MTDIAVIILTKNEELHIERCLEKLRPLEAKQVFIVDCFSTDKTVEIAERMGATVVMHEWPGTQSVQFNWALDNLPIDSTWILRLDADEYLYPNTIGEVRDKVAPDGLPSEVTSCSLSRARRIFGGEIRFGTPDIRLVRLFRFGLGRSTQAEMDEHIVTTEGVNQHLSGRFVDDSLISFDDWQAKHRNYAMREARMFINGTANSNKRMYYRMPPYLRAFAYFCYRYFLRLGFLDGRAGWRWHFWQGLWYRCLVDSEILRMKRERAKTRQ